MAKKVSSSKVNTQKATLFIAILAFGLAGYAVLRSTSAAPGVPTGTVVVDATNSNLKYGGTLNLNATVTSYNKGTVYTSVLCTQDNWNKIIFQYSSSDLNFNYPLVQQAGLEAVGAIWDKTKPATCQAELIYRVQSGKKSTITPLANTGMFTVAPE